MLPDEQGMLAFAGRQLGRNLRDLPFTLTYLFEDGGRARLAATSGITAGTACARDADGRRRMADREPARGASVVVELDGSAFTGLPKGDWPDPPKQALIVPLLQQGDVPPRVHGGRAEPLSPP